MKIRLASPVHRRSFCLLLLAGLALLFTAHGQDPQGESGYVGKKLRSQFGEVPRTAWLMPPNLVLSEEEHATIHVISTGIWEARLVKTVQSAELQGLRERHHVLCQTAAEQAPLRAYLYRLEKASVQEPSRAFFFARPLAGVRAAGLQPAEVSPQVQDALARRWQVRPDALRRSAAYAASDGSVYSFHAFYDPKSREAFAQGIALSKQDGSILAQDFEEYGEECPCVDCALPLYDWQPVGVFFPLNVLRVPGFAYPVLVMDTSTFEGGAISLVTFDENGARVEFRLYEYVMTCPGGSPDPAASATITVP